MRRRISLMVIATFVAALAAINNGCSRDATNGDDDRDDSISFDLNDPRLKERLGEDDGYAFAILYGADIHGSLETCG